MRVTCRAPGLRRAVFFLGDGHIIQHSVVLVEGQIKASMTCQPLKCDQGMHWLDFSDAADGCWQEEYVWLFGHHGACVESTCTNFGFPKLLVRIW